jgi:3-deoxy-manno-octulosonate cytidylyltransferase (CMP-KDO synthetase)
MKISAVIPARYGSTRFEGKPLADILGKPMIQYVYEGVRQSKLIEEVIVATDDQE